jgi:hypothetical protein
VEQFEDILVQILLASATISFIIAITGKSIAFLTLRALGLFAYDAAYRLAKTILPVCKI